MTDPRARSSVVLCVCAGGATAALSLAESFLRHKRGFVASSDRRLGEVPQRALARRGAVDTRSATAKTAAKTAVKTAVKTRRRSPAKTSASRASPTRTAAASRPLQRGGLQAQRSRPAPEGSERPGSPSRTRAGRGANSGAAATAPHAAPHRPQPASAKAQASPKKATAKLAVGRGRQHHHQVASWKRSHAMFAAKPSKRVRQLARQS